MNARPSGWLCTVCGYVHQGPEPPACCPICGATADLFAPHAETPAAATEPLVEQWRCLICEYLHSGEQPPGVCPICGAPPERFEPFSEEAAGPVAVAERQPQEIVIIGAGISGVSAAEAVRKNSSDARITLVNKEGSLPYYRLNLTRYLAGEISSEQLPIHPESWFREQKIRLLCNKELQTIDADAKQLIFCDADRFGYDKLILAMGSHPFVPPITGINKQNVTVLRTREDAEFIRQQCRLHSPCVVIGGGLLGLETAAALARQGLDVTLIEGYGWLMPQQLNRTGGELLARLAAEKGIELRTEARVKQFEGDERVRGVTLETGETLAAGLVIIAAGIRANSYIARLARLKTNNGIVVNNLLETSGADIYAVGDVSEHQGVMYGIWGPSQFQGTIAGINAAGGRAEFAGVPRSNSLKVLDCDLFSIGQIRPGDGSYRIVDGHLANHYYCFVFRDSYLVGSLLFGDTGLSARVKQLIEDRECCAELLGGNPDAAELVRYLDGGACR